LVILLVSCPSHTYKNKKLMLIFKTCTIFILNSKIKWVCPTIINLTQLLLWIYKCVVPHHPRSQNHLHLTRGIRIIHPQVPMNQLRHCRCYDWVRFIIVGHTILSVFGNFLAVLLFFSNSNNCPRKLKFGDIVGLLSFTYLQK
jgi:hypothetical protein